MTGQLLKSCTVALPKGRNYATFQIEGATRGATASQPLGLKALASKALHRNIDRNLPATEQKTDRNFLSEREGKVASVTAVTNTPTPCRDCTLFEFVEIMGADVPGCLYEALEPYPEGWRRLPADLQSCIQQGGGGGI
ncbi:MAG: hypothetical protein HGA69_00360 [Desulfobulbaceae bacterium]|nr:hypothetical protein [Desulfobulbaceae bacterium]